MVLEGKMQKSKIYVASSWRNQYFDGVCDMLSMLGHEVFNFKSNFMGKGFHWSEIDPNYKNWTPGEYRDAVTNNEYAKKGFRADMVGLDGCDTCVLVMPAGRSSSYELGYAMGQKKNCYVLVIDPMEPELMFSGAKILTSMRELSDEFSFTI